jgi:hypothetical protein
MIREAETRLSVHLAHAQFETRLFNTLARGGSIGEIEQACLDDVACLSSQIEDRILSALTELDDQARGAMRSVRKLTVVK